MGADPLFCTLLTSFNRTSETQVNAYIEIGSCNYQATPLCAKALEDGNYNELIDPALKGNYNPHEVACMVACAGASVSYSAKRRPKMSQV